MASLREVVDNYVASTTTVPTLSEFLDAMGHQISAVAPSYKDWTGLSSAINQRFSRSVKQKYGNVQLINTAYSPESWQTLFKLIEARVMHKNGSLDILNSAVPGNVADVRASMELKNQLTADQQHDLKRHLENSGCSESKKSRCKDTDEKASHKIQDVATSSSPNWSKVTESEFWDAWGDLLQCNEAIHDYDLHQYGVIECGYRIKCRATIPEGLFPQSGYGKLGDNIIKDNNQYIKNCYQNREVSSSAFQTAANDQSLLNLNTASCSLVSNVFRQFAAQMFCKNGNGVDHTETAYNYRILWPCIDQVFDALSDSTMFSFIPGEICLKAFDSMDAVYKADGIGYYNGHEVLLLETSGPFGNENTPRHAYDHVKGAFGLLGMFRAIVNKYYHAEISIMEKLGLWFLHARGDKVHLWALRMPSKNIFILERTARAIIPKETKNAYELSKVVKLFWQLKLGLSETQSTLLSMQKSHDDYMEAKSLDAVDCSEQRDDFRKIIAMKVVKPVRGTGYGPLLPRSIDMSLSRSISPINNQ